MSKTSKHGKASAENGGSRSQQRVLRRGRANATQAGILAAAEWINWCKNNGWSEETLLPLESLWWKHHDENGKPKAPNEKS